jgi:type IV pilus assembly protein PilO
MAINISLSKLPWYGQMGVFAVLAGASAFAFWNYYATPKNAEIETRRAALAAIRMDINRGLGIARRLPEFRKEVSSLEIQLDRLRAGLPEQQDVGDLLNRVNALATQSNLKVLRFLPQATTKKTLHTEWPIGLQLEGTYHDLGLFLDRLSKFPRIINVANMKVKAREAQTSRVTVTIDVTATTFVLAEQPKPAAGGA